MISLNQRVSELRQKLADLPLEAIKSLTDCLLEESGDSPTELEEETLRSL